MRHTVLVLLALLVFELGVLTGMKWERWVHRPIVTSDFVVPMPTAYDAEDRYGSDDSGAFPPNREVCTSFDTICWMKT